MIAETTIALLVVLFVFLYMRWTRRYGMLEKLGIPVKAPYLCFGSGPWSFHKYLMFELDRKLLNSPQLGLSLTIGYYEGAQPVILTMDPDLMREVFIKKFDHFQGRMDIPLDECYKTLDILEGEQWAFLRKALSPVFTSGKIKAMVDPIDVCTNKALGYIDNRSTAGELEIDVKQLMSFITLEVILNVAFGVEGNLIGIDCLNTNASLYKKAMSVLSSESPKNCLEDALFFLFQLEPGLASLVFGSTLNTMKYLNGLIKNVINKREESGSENRGDFIDKLRQILKTVKEAKGGKLHNVSPEMVTLQGSLFFIAGFETTSNTLANLIHLLSKNQEAQERCYLDVCQHANSLEEIDYDTVGKMKYVEACINETLRLCPVVTRNQRICNKDVNINGMEIKKGVRIDVPPYALQRHEKFYGVDADEFVPDRFLAGGKSTSDMTFHTFGLGPRQCLGMRFALVQMKLVIAKLLFGYKVLHGAEIEYQNGDAFLMTIKKSKATLQKRQPV